MNNIIEFIKLNNLGKYQENISFKSITSLRLGGNAKVVYYPNSIFSLRMIYDYIVQNSIRYLVIGCGTNILCGDDEFDGIVIKLNSLVFKGFITDKYAIISSGYLLNDLYYKIGKYYGFSKLSLIPGTIGGGLVTNCGAYGIEMKDVVLSVYVLDKNGFRWIDKYDGMFSYRDSVFQNNDAIILYVKIKLREEEDEIKKWKRKKLQSQKVEGYNAGSTFKNPNGMYAWKLIKDICGEKSIGRCAISQVHSNFLINKGGGKSKDMMELIDFIKNEVKKRSGITLDCEWKIFNFIKDNSEQ